MKKWGLMTLCFMLLSGSIEVASEQNYVEGQLIVKMKASSSILSAGTHENVHSRLGATSVRALPWKKMGIQAQGAQSEEVLVTFPNEANLEVLAAQYRQSGQVEYAEPVYKVHADALVNDPYYRYQDYLTKTDLAFLRDIEYKEKVLVAVVDSGVDGTNADLQSSMFTNTKELANGRDNDGNGYVGDVSGYNFSGYSVHRDNAKANDNYGHGTHIAGIIAAQINNGISLAGLTHAAEILNVKFLDAAGNGNQLDGAAAVRYAADMGARVINCSWGYAQFNQVLKDAVAYAISKGAIVVTSAGNSGSDLDQYPAAFESVINVASVEIDKSHSDFSNYGSHITFAEYGRAFLGLTPSGGLAIKSGTSQSAAVMSAIVATAFGAKPSMTARDVKTLLLNSAEGGDSSAKNRYKGNGIVNITNFGRNLSLFQESTHSFLSASVAALKLTRVLNFPNPCSDSGTKFGFELSDSADVTIHIYSNRGTLIKTLQSFVNSGYQTLNWDTLNDSNQPAKNGTYFYTVLATKDGDVARSKGRLTILR